MTLLFLLFSLPAEGTAVTDSVPFLSRAHWMARISPEDQKLILENGEIFREMSNGENFQLYPGDNPPAELESIKNGMKRYFGTETLFFLPLTIPGNSPDREKFLLKTYNLTRQISTLTGMDYYSASRGYRRTLFHEFYAIGEPGSRTPLPDPLVPEIPLDDTFRIFQNDATFGNAEYEIHYRFSDPVISMTMKNMTTLVYKIVPVAGKEKLFMHAKIIPVQEGFLFYGVCLVEGRNIPVIGKSTSDSLYNRVKALFEWFSIQISGS